MQTHGLEPDFPAAALLEANAARPPAPHADIRDLRALAWFSIDNDDTQDLDQLSVAESLPGGATRLLVAIADVDALARRGSAVDAHAALNTTSVYTAAGTFPMLPPVLSTDRTSLHEGQERLAVVVEMQVEDDGAVTQHQLYRAAVTNQAKLTYDGVSRWLDGDGPLPASASSARIQEQVRLHDHLATRLRRWRQRRGALDVRTPAARPVLEQGRLIDLRADDRNRAKDLIADVMIATNAATARFLAQAGFPSLRRFLQSPRRWDRIEALAAALGTVLPPEPDAVALERFLTDQRTRDPEGFGDLSLRVVKMLGSGSYVAAAPGAPELRHFGLAVSDYAHSTAPNRRYPDLVTQRLVKACLAGEAPPYSHAALAELARHCTLQEDNANKVERTVLKAAGAALLQGRIGDAFDAIVTGAAPKGTYVRIAQPLLEGRLVRGVEGLDVGDALRVRLVGVDAARGYIDLERA
ncbi:RNB domain-containing ribonuclease [Ramlibacter henchirensis]|uniref:RNB domain-containing ribonuclease n=2 Tax=Ramlibacter henchirensis TaxID=204072 RepID=A0A4Z0C772_9BURK|nr:RNB domain-containing ribonuclease [Ramlibacter henchirensis]